MAGITPYRQSPLVLATLLRLRWLAVAGQVLAVAITQWVLNVRLPLVPIGCIILLTAISNLALSYWRPVGAIHGVLVLDVILLTLLLAFTGGPHNPFAALYLVHVAMAVIVLDVLWMWIVVAMVALGSALLLRWHWPLEPVSAHILDTGNWVSLVLVAVLIAAFIGHVIRALRQREQELIGARERAA